MNKGMKSDIEQSLIMRGYIIAEIEVQPGKWEKWAYKRHPEMFPYDYSWFFEIPMEERIKNGIRIE